MSTVKSSIAKRPIGKTDMLVTRMAYGAMELRLAENRLRADEILNTVLDSGINFIDTSQDYGASEELIGKHISQRRGEFYIATKCGCNLADGTHIFNRRHITANLEDSLKKLKTDYIDFWQLHCVVPADLPGGANDDVIQTMFDMRQAGKVRYIGVSYKNGSRSDAFYPTDHQENYAVEMTKWGVFDAFQMVYGALTRISENKMAEMKALGTGIIARGVLKKYHDDYDERFTRASLDELLEQGESRTDFLIRFAMCVDSIDTMIVGSGNPDHIRSNVRAAEKGPLSAGVFGEAVRRLSNQ